MPEDAALAARWWSNHLFDATPVARLQATVVVRNHGSAKVAEAAGMRLEGLHRGAYRFHGEYHDMSL